MIPWSEKSWIKFCCPDILGYKAVTSLSRNPAEPLESSSSQLLQGMLQGAQRPPGMWSCASGTLSTLRQEPAAKPKPEMGRKQQKGAQEGQVGESSKAPGWESP